MDKERLKEIEDTLSCLKRTWCATPSLRLGQLMSNITPSGRDIFYIRDKDMQKLLNTYRDMVVTKWGIKP